MLKSARTREFNSSDILMVHFYCLIKDLNRALLKSARTREFSSSDIICNLAFPSGGDGLLMAHFNGFIRINVHDLSNADRSFWTGQISFVEMCVPVEKITGFGNANQPVQCF